MPLEFSLKILFTEIEFYNQKRNKHIVSVVELQVTKHRFYTVRLPKVNGQDLYYLSF